MAQVALVKTPHNQSYHATNVFLIPAILLLPPELVVVVAILQHIPAWLKNRTTGKQWHGTAPYTSTFGTAEWIAETPLLIGTNAGFATLPNLTPVHFDNATANSKTFGATASDTGTLTGVLNSDGITATFASAGDGASADVATYTISDTFADPNGKLGNYLVHETDAIRHFFF